MTFAKLPSPAPNLERVKSARQRQSTVHRTTNPRPTVAHRHTTHHNHLHRHPILGVIRDHNLVAPSSGEDRLNPDQPKIADATGHLLRLFSDEDLSGPYE